VSDLGVFLEQELNDGVEAVLVHSSFAPFRKAGFSLDELIEKFISINGLTVFMPAMTWRIVNDDYPVFHVNKTPSHVGVLAERFRSGYAEMRSLHPTHSVSGYGPLSETILRYHQLSVTPVDGCSPFGKLLEFNSKIFLLNVDLSVCTNIHYYEERFAPDFYLDPRIFHAELIDTSGNSIGHYFRRHNKKVRDFPKFWKSICSRGVSTFCAGPISISVFSISTFHSVMMEMFTENNQISLKLEGKK